MINDKALLNENIKVGDKLSPFHTHEINIRKKSGGNAHNESEYLYFIRHVLNSRIKYYK